MSVFRALIALLGLLIAQVAAARPVLLISVDGLRPADVLSAGDLAPNLRALARGGSFSSAVRGPLPTLTYPAHTTLVSGASPSHHGIGGNEAFDPLRRNQEGWMWYANDITADTLWAAARRRGLTTAAINWPVTVGAAIDWNVPQYWRAGSGDDVKLLAALASPGLAGWLQRRTGQALPNPRDPSAAADRVRMDHAAALVAAHHPALLALHLEALDHASHDFGPASPEARSVLRELDRGIADLMITIRRSAPDTVVLLVSDHGFIPVERFINLEAALREAGLITADTDGNVTDWRAAIWPMSGTAAIMLKHPDDAQDRAALANLLNRLAADPANGVAAVLDPQKIAARGGSRDAAFWVAFRPGFAAGGYAAGPLVQDSWLKGTHGYLPETPGMEALFIASGRGIAVGRDLGPIDMRRIAPTAARLLGVALRDAEAAALSVRN